MVAMPKEDEKGIGEAELMMAMMMMIPEKMSLQW